jgi:Tol biopolymer transport system component
MRWPTVAAVFALSFAGSFLYFGLVDRDGGGEPDRAAERPRPAAERGRLVVTFSANAADADRGFLASIALDGSDERSLVEPPGGRGQAGNAAPAVSPNGKMVAFQRAVAMPARPLPPFIYLVPLDASRPERRLTRGHTAEVDPAWSPDGAYIAFAREVRGRFDLFTSAPDGSRLRRLTNTPDFDELGPAWSPDGEWIAFARYHHGVEGGSGDVWEMSANGGGEERLLGGRRDYSSPAWSPDGRRLALVQDGRVAVMRADGAAPHRITRESEGMEWRPSWSPNGTRIVFTRDPGTILVVDPDGSHLVEVPFDKPATGAVWGAAR